MKRILSDSAWVTGGQLMTSLSAFVGMVFLANVLSQEDLGIYRYVLSIITILAIANLPGLDTALVRSTARGFSKQFGSVVRHKILWGLWGSLGALAVSGYYFLHGNSFLGGIFLILTPLLPFYGSFFIYFFYLQGKKRFESSAIINGLCRVIFLFVLLLGTSIFPTALGASVFFMLGVIFSQLAGYLFTLRYSKTQIDNQDPDIYTYGKELTVLGAWNIIAVNIDKLLVWIFLGPLALATYTIASLIPMESIRVGRIVSQVLLPRFSGETTSENIISLRVLGYICLALLGVWLIFALISPYFFALFFPLYADAYLYATVAMLVLLSTPSYIIRSYFTGIKAQFELRMLLIVSPVVKTIILALGLWQFGLWGAIWAIALGGLFELGLALGLQIRRSQKT